MGNCGSGEQTKPQNNKQQQLAAERGDNSPDRETTRPTSTTTKAEKNEPTNATSTSSEKEKATTEKAPAGQQQQEQSSSLPATQDSITRPPQSTLDASKPSAASDEEMKKRREEEEEAAKKKKQQQQQEEEEAAAAAAKKKQQEEQEEAERKQREKEEEEKKQKEAEEEEAEKKKKQQAEEEEKYKKERLEAAINNFKKDVATAQTYRTEGPADLRDRSIHRACLNNPSLVQIKDLFGKKDAIKFKEMIFKMRIKKGLLSRGGFHEVLGVIIGNFFFYFPPAANDPKSPNAEAVQCLGSMYLKGVKIDEMDSVENKRRLLLTSAVPRKKVEGKKNAPDENTLQLGFDDELQRSRFEECVEDVAIPKPSEEVAAALKARGESVFIGKIGGEVEVQDDGDE